MLFSTFVGIGLGTISAFGFYSGIKEYNVIYQQKKELSQKELDFEDLHMVNLPNGKYLVNTLVRTNSGLLEIYKTKSKTEVIFAQVKNNNYFVIEPTIKDSHMFSQLIEPKLGLSNYIPSLSLTSYLLKDLPFERFEGSGNAIRSILSNNFNSNNLLLNPLENFITIFYPFKNYRIYMYGTMTNSGDFVSEIIGIKKNDVINKVYESESTNNINKLLFSIIGFTLAMGIIGKS
jgi:hypothetical protein